MEYYPRSMQRGTIRVRWRAILGMTVIGLAAGCGGGGGSSSSQGSTQSSVRRVVQTNTFQTTGSNFATDTAVRFNAVTTAGDTIWVAATVSDLAGAHTISVSDTQGNAFTLIDQVNDGSPGTQSVAHFYAANIVGDSTTPDTITVTWGNDNYKGVLIAEISGTTAAPLAGHARNDQVGLGAGSNNVTAGPIDLSSAQTPALLVALSMNTFGGTSDTGGTGFGGPTAGNGMTQVEMSWNWGVNLATLATASVSSAESVSSLFSASGAGSYVTVVAAFH
jgi:hypothetical protein